MRPDELLTCGECGGEGRLVRINAHLIRPGHVQNPRNRMHPFTLSRSADDDNPSRMAALMERRGHRRQSRVREDAPNRRTNGKRAASDGRSRTANPSGTSKPPAEAASNADPSRTPRLPLGLGTP